MKKFNPWTKQVIEFKLKQYNIHYSEGLSNESNL